jgi:hypothetical protein
MQRTATRTVSCSVGLLLLLSCSTDASTVDETSAWGSTESGSEGLQVPPTEEPAPVVGGQVTDDIILEQWAYSCTWCGNDPEPQLPSPEEVMRALPAEQRAPRLLDVLTRLRLVSGEAHCLLWLMAGTRDPKALDYISTVFDSARQVALRRWSEPWVPPERIDSEAENIRASAITSGALLEGPEALAFVLRGAKDSSTVVRQAAAIALANRPDFDNPEYLRDLRDSLDPAQRPAVDEVL